jgi:hypothetical protein
MHASARRISDQYCRQGPSPAQKSHADWLGDVIEPSVSVPMANPHSPAAVVAAGPALDPFDPSFKFHGLRVRPPYQISLYASALTLVLPSNTAPPARKFVENRSFSTPERLSAPSGCDA